MRKISILSREEDYRAFLTLLCREHGFAVTDGSDRRSPGIVLVDLDAIPAFSLPARPTVIGYTRRHELTAADGVDHLLHRPFSIEALASLLRGSIEKEVLASPTESEPEIAFGEGSVRWQGEDIPLTANEYAILRYLYERRGQPVTREELSHQIGHTKGNAVDVYVSYLRKKLEYPFGLKWIHTVRKIGYTVKP